MKASYSKEMHVFGLHDRDFKSSVKISTCVPYLLSGAGVHLWIKSGVVSCINHDRT